MLNLKRNRLVGLGLLALVALSLPALSSPAIAQESEEVEFRHFLEHYEMVRLELLNDTFQATSGHGREMLQVLTGLAGNWSADRAGVAPENGKAAQELLPELTAAATELSSAKDIKAVRDAFYSLSKPLVRYRSLLSGDQPAVAYCPMAKRSWLQPGTKLGNPYYGQSMPTCGEVVEG